MKYRYNRCLWALVGFLPMGATVVQGDDDPRVIPPDAQAVAEVLAGRVQTAEAAWWGFDPADSTRQLQAALDSPARRVVVGKTSGPWIVTTIQLPSDKEIVFERGVVVEAKRGEFLGKGDCLFTAKGRKRLTIRGDGATLRMHKADYHRPPYDLAEWRHALSIRGCEDVTVEGLILQDSGGDGIYLGTGSDGATNRKITIRDVICDGNNRQGVSVITAENLLMENCIFRNTRGTAPQAGIDFEPNRPNERLVNCVLRNCRSENNAGHAYHLYLGFMDETSPPVSIRFENCTSTGCERYSTYVGIANREGRRTVRGSIEYVNCRFDTDQGGGVYIRGNEADGCRVSLERCEIIRRDDATSRLAPITIEAPRQLDLDAGNVFLRDCVIRDSIDRRPLDISASPMTRLRNIAGSLVWETPQERREISLDQQQLEAWFPEHGKVARVPRLDFDWRKAEPVMPAALDGDSGIPVRLRREAALLTWGEAGELWQLTVMMEPVGRHTPTAGTLTVTTSDGQTQRLRPTGEANRFTYRFMPFVSGPYRLDWQGDSSTTIRPIECTAPLTLLGKPGGIRFIKPVGTLYFTVPQGVERFALLIAGEGTGETIKATVRNSRGDIVGERDTIGPPHVFVFERKTSPKSETWSLTLQKATEGFLEDVSVESLGVPPVFGFKIR